VDGAGLIAPLDLTRFAAVFLLLVILPGYVLATAARAGAPRVERLAFALPCALSVITVYGLLTALLQLPFTSTGYVVIAAAIVLGGGVYAGRRSMREAPSLARSRRLARLVNYCRGISLYTHADWSLFAPLRQPNRPLPPCRPTRSAGPCEPRARDRRAYSDTPLRRVERLDPMDNSRALRKPDRWWIVAASVALIDGVVALLIHAGAVVPAAVDVLSHVVWTQNIARSHTFSIALLSAHPGAADGAFYPPAFHAMAALLADASGVVAYRAVFYSAVLAVPLLPIALFAYTRALTRSARVAGLTALASLAFEPLPFFALAQGLYPFVVSCLFIPALALTLADGLGLAGGRGCARSVGLAALLGVGLFYTHPTEFVTVGLLVLVTAPIATMRARAWLRAGAYGAIVAAVWGGTALPALAAVRRTMVAGAQAEIQTRHDFAAPPHTTAGTVWSGYMYDIYGRNVSYLLCALALAGLVWCLIQRRQRGLVVAQLALVAVFLDASSLNLLRPLYVLSFPWALGERLAPTHYWVTLPLAGLGLDAALRLRQRRPWGQNRALLTLLAAPCALLGMLLPLDVAARHSIAYETARVVMAPTDLGALAWLRRHAVAGSVVINDADPSRPAIFDVPIDAGRWMSALGTGIPLFAQGGAGPGPLEERLYLARHIADTPLPPRAARYVAHYHIHARYVFFGAAVPPGATRQLQLTRLLADPRLRLVYTSAPACRVAGPRDRTDCSHGVSYVFAMWRGIS